MSKAFTREDDEAQPPPAAPGPARLSPGEVRYLTPEGAQELRDELARLGDEHARLASELAASAERAGAIERRMRQIQAILASSTVAAIDVSQDRVLFGAWVSVEDEAGELTTFRVVGPDEADARAHKISASSPLARALLGKRAGDEVSVERPRGAAAYTIVSIRFGP